MKHPCSCKILFEGLCKYDGVVDTDKHAYSVRHINGKDYYYHYLDYVESNTEFIQIASSNKKKLCQHLLSLYVTRKENWIKNILSACGYKVEE